MFLTLSALLDPAAAARRQRLRLVPVVTQARCEVHRNCLAHGVAPRNVRTLAGFEKACLSLYEVCIAIHLDTDTNHELMGHSCDCIGRDCTQSIATR